MTRAKQAWPFGAVGHDAQWRRQVAEWHPGKPRLPGTSTLQTASIRQLRIWLKKARANGGVLEPNHGRTMTVGQITAALHARTR